MIIRVGKFIRFVRWSIGYLLGHITRNPFPERRPHTLTSGFTSQRHGYICAIPHPAPTPSIPARVPEKLQLTATKIIEDRLSAIAHGRPATVLAQEITFGASYAFEIGFGQQDTERIFFTAAETIPDELSASHRYVTSAFPRPTPDITSSYE